MRYFITLLAVSLFALHLSGQDLNQRWSKLINQGKSEYAVENYGSALQLFQKASSIIPTDTTAYQYIIDCAFKVHKTQPLLNAIDRLKTIHEVKPEHYAYAIASIYSYMNNHKKALQYVQEAKQKFPENKRILLEEANVYYDYGDTRTAREKLGKLIQKYPEMRPPYDLLIKINKELPEHYGEALAVTRKAIAQFTDNLEYKKQETDILLRMKRIDEARNKLEALIEENPENPTLYYNLALTHYETGDYQKSADICKKAIELNPEFLEAYYNVGAFYYNYALRYTRALSDMTLNQYENQGSEFEQKAIGFFEKARPYYAKAIELNPDELDAYKSINTIDLLLKNLRANREEMKTDSLSRQEAQTDSTARQSGEQDSTLTFAQARDTASVSGAIEEVIKGTTTEAKNTQTTQVKQETDKRVEVKSEQAAPVIVDISFEYPEGQRSLAKGENGNVKVTIGNQGKQAQKVNFILMEPVISPYLKYRRTNPVSRLKPGEVVTLNVPVTYIASGAKTLGIDQLGLKQKKFRAFTRAASGQKSGLVEFSLNMGKGETGAKTQTHVSGIQGTNYLMLIGSDEYAHWDNPGSGIKHIKQLKETLTGVYQFNPNDVFELYNSDLSLFNIRNALIRLKETMTQSDNLILVYAGKTWYNINEDMAYWVPPQARKNAQGDYLSAKSLISYLNDIPARHIVVFTEGVFPRSSMIPDAPDNFDADNDDLPSRWALCGHEATDTLTNSPDHAYLNYLNKSLKENTRPKIGISEIVNYMKGIMGDKTERHPVGGPLQMKANQCGDYIFYKSQE